MEPATTKTTLPRDFCLPPGPLKTLVLGLGNDLLTDDSIGLRLAADLQSHLTGTPNLTILQTAEMGLALLDFVVGFDQLVLIDAVQTRRVPPGFVHQVGHEDLHCVPLVAPHFLGIGELLALGAELGLPMPQLVTIFAIEVDDPYTVGTELTPILRTAYPGILTQIEAAVRSAVVPSPQH